MCDAQASTAATIRGHERVVGGGAQRKVARSIGVGEVESLDDTDRAMVARGGRADGHRPRETVQTRHVRHRPKGPCTDREWLEPDPVDAFTVVEPADRHRCGAVMAEFRRDVTVTTRQAQVSVRTPYFPCGGPVSLAGNGDLGGAAQSTPLGPSTALPEHRAMLTTEAGTREYLTTHANDIAHRFGVPGKGAKRYVKINRRAAVKRQGNGDEVADDRPVYVVQVDGAFSKATSKGRTAKGSVLELLFDAETGELTDLGIESTSNNLNTLGAVQTLS